MISGPTIGHRFLSRGIGITLLAFLANPALSFLFGYAQAYLIDRLAWSGGIELPFAVLLALITVQVLFRTALVRIMVFCLLLPLDFAAIVFGAIMYLGEAL